MTMGLEAAVLITALALLLLDLWTPPAEKRVLSYAAVIAVGVIFLASFAFVTPGPRTAFGGMYVLDEYALYFKRFFLLAALLVLLFAVESPADRERSETEYSALTLFALTGMMFAASANDFSLLFLALELVTITFYVLTSYHRRQPVSLEAGAKYLILGALSSAFLVYGIALVYGASGTLSLPRLAAAPADVLRGPLFETGLLLVFAGLAFKLAAVPFQVWAPDVYQGAPTPTTAFLAIGSKAAGIALLVRWLMALLPGLDPHWQLLLMIVAGASMVYGVLCAIPQRNLKRLLAYSSIANAGYLLLGICTTTREGLAAVLFYLAGYLFALAAAFGVLCLVARTTEEEEISALAGLHRQSPLLAATLATAMVSLAGIPPLAGFFGKFLLLKAAVSRGEVSHGMYALVGIAILGVVISIYYYFGVIRTLYWTEPSARRQGCRIGINWPARVALWTCLAGLLWLGIFPNAVVNLADQAIGTLM